MTQRINFPSKINAKCIHQAVDGAAQVWEYVHARERTCYSDVHFTENKAVRELHLQVREGFAFNNRIHGEHGVRV